MSTVKSTKSQPKFTVDASVFERLKKTFPNFECTLMDIRFPKKEFVVQFYTFILEELHVTVPKVTHKPLENQLQGDAHRELYTEVQQLVNLSQVLRYILIQLLGQFQFGLDDLVEPNPARNSAFMFALLNFFNFADIRLVELTDKLEVIGERKATLEQLLEKRESISRGLNQRAMCIAKRSENAREIKVKKAEIEELKEESKSFELLSEKKQSELDDVNRHITRVQAEIEEVRKVYQKFEAQRVQSPDALRHNLNNLKKKLDETKQQFEQAQESAKDKKKNIEIYETLEKEQDIRTASITDIVETAKINKELESQFVNLQSKIKLELDGTEAAQNKLKGLKDELSQLSAQLTNLQLQWEKNKGSMKESIRHLTEEKMDLKRKQDSDLKSIMESMEKEQSEVNELIKENIEYNKFCEKLYAELNEKEHSFVASKVSELDSFMSDIDQAKNRRDGDASR